MMTLPVDNQVHQLDRFMQTRRGRLMLYVSLFLIAFALRAPFIHQLNLNMDEDMQGRFAALGTFNPLVTELAATHSQPPLDYYIESIPLQLFGFNEFSHRIHAVIIGSFACLCIFILVYHYYGLRAGLIAYLIYTFGRMNVEMSVFGRPYATASLFVIIFLMTYENLIRARERDQRRDSLLLAGATLALLMSIGSQPFIFVISALLLGPILTFFFSNRAHAIKNTTHTALSLAVPLLLYIPILRLIIDKSTPWVDHNYGGFLPNAFKAAFAFSFHDYAPFVAIINYWKYLLLFAIPALLLTLYRYFTGAERIEKEKVEGISMVLGMALLFPLGLWVAFHTVMSHKGAPSGRYLIIFNALATIIAAVGFDRFISLASRWQADQRLKRLVGTVALSAFLVIFGANIKHIIDFRKASRPETWRELYALVRQDVRTGDIFIMDTLVDKGWKPDWFGMTQYFSDHIAKVAFFTTKEENTVFELRKISDYAIKGQKVYFTFQAKEPYMEILRRKESFSAPHFKVIDPGGQIICIEYIDDTMPLIQKVESFYAYLLTILPETETTARITRILVDINLTKGNFGKAATYLARLVAIDTDGKHKEYCQRAGAFLQEVYQKYLEMQGTKKETL